jgi:hypothetical protein
MGMGVTEMKREKNVLLKPARRLGVSFRQFVFSSTSSNALQSSRRHGLV